LNDIRAELDELYGPRGRYPRKFPSVITVHDTPENRAILAAASEAAKEAKESFFRLAGLLHKIKIFSLWKLEKWPTFESYLDHKIGLSKTQTNYYIRSYLILTDVTRSQDRLAKCEDGIKTAACRPNLSQINMLGVRVLLPLDRVPEGGKRLEVLQLAENTEEGITEKTVKHYARLMCGAAPPAPPVVEPTEEPEDTPHPAIVIGERVMNAVSRIIHACTDLESFVRSEYGKMAPAGQPVDKIKELAKAIQAAAPYTLCDCGSGCGKCGQRGWLRKIDCDTRGKK